MPICAGPSRREVRMNDIYPQKGNFPVGHKETEIDHMDLVKGPSYSANFFLLGILAFVPAFELWRTMDDILRLHGQLPTTKVETRRRASGRIEVRRSTGEAVNPNILIFCEQYGRRAVGAPISGRNIRDGYGPGFDGRQPRCGQKYEREARKPTRVNFVVGHPSGGADRIVEGELHMR